MKTTEETTYKENMKNECQPTEQGAEVKSRKDERWQSVSLGGVAGIAMGAAGSYALNALAAGNTVEETNEEATDGTSSDTPEAGAVEQVSEVRLATVDQSLSFGDAFAAARAEVGSGGVFMWHGRLYNTFTAAEWQQMSDAEKEEFADGVAPYLPQQTPHTVQHTSTETHTEEVTNVRIVQQPEKEETTDEPEVHFLGVTTHTTEDGETMNIGHMTVEGVNVALVDVDNDQVFDVQWADVNQNMELEEEEIRDISDRGFTVDTFSALSSAEAEQSMGQAEQVSHVEEDLAPDMPDYMNDADVNLV